MAQLIFSAISRNESNLMAVKVDDFVAALEDGVHPGTKVVGVEWYSPPLNGNWHILDVPGVSKRQLFQLIGALTLRRWLARLVPFRPRKRNANRLSRSKLPASVLSEMLATGRAILTAPQARAAIEVRI